LDCSIGKGGKLKGVKTGIRKIVMVKLIIQKKITRYCKN
jgi:ribosomal protein S12